MSKWRKKPVVIEAEQWFPGVDITGVAMHRRDGERTLDPARFDYATVETLEGVMSVTPGDWVITGVKGEKYACQDEIFRLTYEPVDDELHDDRPSD